MLIGFFTFEVVVFDGSNHILSEGDVAANVVTLEAFTVMNMYGAIRFIRGESVSMMYWFRKVPNTDPSRLSFPKKRIRINPKQ